jgi:hypothetical protein
MIAACRRFNESADDEEAVSPDFALDPKRASAGPLISFLRKKLGGMFDERALYDGDSKYERLRQAIRLHWEDHPQSKIVLFAYFKPTLYYLNKRLCQDGIPSLLLTGDETRDKQEIVDEFSRPETARILLSSEVGSEGLDLQFASALVNYDLPWNPMVVEQRIGRIHRIGQQAERIVVMNLICEGTVDERIYDRLYDRLHLFERTLGDLEAVIGPLINDLTKDLFSLRLSAHQQAARIDQTALAVENQIKLEEQLENNASVLAAYGDYIINQITAAHERGDWINGRDLQAYVLSFFRRQFPATRIQGMDQDENTFELELDTRAWRHFDEFLTFNKLSSQTRLSTREKSRIQFDHRVFTPARAGIEVIHQAHPIIRFISHHLRTNRVVQPVAVAAEIPAQCRPVKAVPGLYAFVSQRWTIEGLRDYEKLHHEVVSLQDQQPIEDAVVAGSIIEAAAAVGQESEDVPQPGDQLLALLAAKADELEFAADVAFNRFLTQIERENEDRKQIQLRGLERFEQRRATAIVEVRDRHRVAGRESLVAAMEGQLKSLRNKCSDQRQKIESKRTTSDGPKTIAAGFILVH